MPKGVPCHMPDMPGRPPCGFGHFSGWSWYTHTVDGGGIRIGRLSGEQARQGRQSAQFVMDRSKGGLFHRAMFRKTDGFSTDRDERWIGFSTFLPAAGPEGSFSQVSVPRATALRRAPSTGRVGGGMRWRWNSPADALGRLP